MPKLAFINAAFEKRVPAKIVSDERIIALQQQLVELKETHRNEQLALLEGQKALRTQIERILKSNQGLKTRISEIPKQETTDLSPLTKAIDALTPQLDEMSKKLDKKRNYEFDIIREPIDGLVEKIAVKQT